MNIGFVKMHRTILDWEWYSDTPTRSVFMHLILTANHQEKKWMGTTIKPGQLITSLGSLADALGLSVQQVRTALRKLTTSKIITITATNKYSLITLNNWGKHNGKSTRKATNKQQTSNKQSTTTKNDKNVKNTYLGDLKEWLSKYNQTYGKNFQSTKGLLPNYSYWREEYSQEELLAAIPKIRYHDWLSDKHKPALIFRQTDQSDNPVDRIGEILSVKGKVYLN